MIAEIVLFESLNLAVLDFCLCCWMKNDIYKREVVTWDNLRAWILDASASTTKHEHQLRQRAHDLRTQAAKCIEVDSEIFEHLL